MTTMPLGAALEALSARNGAALTLYREAARHILSRSLASLALSMADQHRELGRELAGLLGLPGLDGAMAELDFDPARLNPPEKPASESPEALLELMLQVEATDYESLAALSGSLLPLSADAAERCAALAEQARKRSSWARDHLDLLKLE